jgi:uncharacterized RDD family membrane protein YckC
MSYKFWRALRVLRVLNKSPQLIILQKTDCCTRAWSKPARFCVSARLSGANRTWSENLNEDNDTVEKSASDNNELRRHNGRDEKMSTGNSSQFDINHWLLRLVAFIIDSIIIGIIAGIIFFLIIVSLFFSGGLLFAWTWGLGFPFLLGILEILYFVFMEVSYGETLGKRVLGLQVQTVNGSKVTFDKAFIRNISKIYWLFLLIDWILAIAIAGHDQRQKYTDRIAGTTVVSVKQAFSSVATPPPPPPPPPPP